MASGAPWRELVECGVLPAALHARRLSHGACDALLARAAQQSAAAALLVWRLYALMWPALHGDALRRSVRRCAPTADALQRLLDAEQLRAPTDAPEWRWRDADADDAAARAKFVAEAAALHPALAARLQTTAARHWSLSAPSSALVSKPQLAAAIARRLLLLLE